MFMRLRDAGVSSGRIKIRRVFFENCFLQEYGDETLLKELWIRLEDAKLSVIVG